VAHRPRKKRLDFGGNPDHVRVRAVLGLQLGGVHRHSAHVRSNNFATSAALAEVCTMLSSIPGLFLLIILQVAGCIHFWVYIYF